QAGHSAPILSSVSCVCPEPSAAMTQTWAMPVRFEVNAIREPSGDHDAAQSSAGLSVSRMLFEPSASTAYSSVLPSRVLSNARRPPSGDHDPDRSSPAASVIRVGAPPAGATRHRSASGLPAAFAAGKTGPCGPWPTAGPTGPLDSHGPP